MKQRTIFATSLLGWLLAAVGLSCTPKDSSGPGAQPPVAVPASADPAKPAPADAPVADLASATRERPLTPAPRRKGRRS
jgi:hypothetical protein